MTETFLFKFLICLAAGFGAGVGTGFAGMSAAVVISPMLIAFLGIDAYQAVGIALASDVLASAASAYTYKKHDNLDIRNALLMMGIVLVFTIIGSVVANFLPHVVLGGVSEVTTLLMGLKFLFWPTKDKNESRKEVSKRTRLIRTIICSVYIGCVCGFMGAGGGMMMLLTLTVVMGYDLKTAVGTSVFVMTFTALTGAASHFVIGAVDGQGYPDPWCLVLCVLFTLIFARVAALLANKLNNRTLNLLTGILLTVMGVIILAVEYLPVFN